MDIPTLIAYVGIILALIWAGYERVRAGRNKNAQYLRLLTIWLRHTANRSKICTNQWKIYRQGWLA
jgi:hypothetical protein